MDLVFVAVHARTDHNIVHSTVSGHNNNVIMHQQWKLTKYIAPLTVPSTKVAFAKSVFSSLSGTRASHIRYEASDCMAWKEEE